MWIKYFISGKRFVEYRLYRCVAKDSEIEDYI